MPHCLRWEGHGVYRRFTGVVSAAEFLATYREMTSDVRFGSVRYIISDYLDARPGPDVTERELRQFAELVRLRYYDSPDTVEANVVTDPDTLARVRYYEGLGISPHCMRDFPTAAEARRWIASNPRRGWTRPPTSAVSPAERHL